jgi:hypothetical protein
MCVDTGHTGGAMPMMGSECAERERMAVRPDAAVRCVVDEVFGALFAASVRPSPAPDDSDRRVRHPAAPAMEPAIAASPVWEREAVRVPALAGR